ncbi:MAG: winged helix-turn-helix transcriptional regulator [Deltaproteobacteria bacterium]|nr:winged helix-turn-helix transcriptional regulator [Deltaproteobacteria bacterium]
MPIKCDPPETDRGRIKRWKKTMKFTPDLDERAALLDVVAQSTRLRLFYLLDQLGEVCVCDLAEILGVTQSAVSQQLAKFKAYGLVAARRDNQTLFYRLSDGADVKLLRRVALAGLETQP